MKAVAGFSIVFLILSNSSVWAQDVRERIQTGKDVGSLVSAGAQWLADGALAEEIRQAREAEQASIEQLKPWLGSRGVLYEVSIGEQPRGQGMPYQIRLGSISRRGVGASPEEALARSLSTPQVLGRRTPQGFVWSEEKSYFVWITKDQEQGIILGHARRLRDKAFTLHSSQRL